MRAGSRNNPHWQVERKIPLALIITVFGAVAGQTVTGIVFAQKLDSRVETLEKASPTFIDTRERLIKTEVQLQTISSDIAAIKLLLQNQPARK